MGENWDESRMYVLESVDTLKDGQRETLKELAEIKAAIATLKVQSSLWGGLTGVIGGVLTAVVALILRAR